jgi:hypothetical protein
MRIVPISAVIMLMASTAWASPPVTDTSIDHTLATDAEVSSGDTQAIAPLPLEIKTQGDITYVTGGVGDEELRMLLAKGGDFNLHLLLNAKGGDYLSNIAIHVTDAKGTGVLDVSDAGPYLYVKLAPGKYSLEATRHESETKKISFTVGKGTVNRDIVFSD